jgi:hypothetical protein
MEFLTKLQNYHQACYSGLFVLTHEEARFSQELSTLRERNPDISVHEWDAQSGLVYKGGPDASISHPHETANSATLLEYIQKYKQGDSIFVLKDFHLHFDKVINIRLLRNAWNKLKRLRNMIVFVGHKFNVPHELIKEVQLLDYSLPGEEAIKERLMFIKNSVDKGREETGAAPLEISDLVIDDAVAAAKGMTHQEVENAFALAYISTKKFNQAFVEAVFQEKIAQLKKNGLLTYMEPNVSFDNVGGMSGLKKWLLARKNAYSKEAKEYKLPMPKGMLLASVPGSGKSLVAKAIAKEFDCPLFALDIGSMFDSLVGNSEKNMREMIKTVESIGKCVILID